MGLDGADTAAQFAILHVERDERTGRALHLLRQLSRRMDVFVLAYVRLDRRVREFDQRMMLVRTHP